jgi:hypothetical protein
MGLDKTSRVPIYSLGYRGDAARTLAARHGVVLLGRVVWYGYDLYIHKVQAAAKDYTRLDDDEILHSVVIHSLFAAGDVLLDNLYSRPG